MTPIETLGWVHGIETLGWVHGYLRCSLERGEGLSPEQLERVFDRVHTACASLNPDYAELDPRQTEATA